MWVYRLPDLHDATMVNTDRSKARRAHKYISLHHSNNEHDVKSPFSTVVKAFGRRKSLKVEGFGKLI